jgi:hypothetical protein
MYRKMVYTFLHKACWPAVVCFANMQICANGERDKQSSLQLWGAKLQNLMAYFKGKDTVHRAASFSATFFPAVALSFPLSFPTIFSFLHLSNWLWHRSCARFCGSSTKFCVTIIFFQISGKIYLFCDHV